MTKLAVVLGDQLNHDSKIFDHIEMGKDVIFMAEVQREANHVWSHKARIALFFSAMRHFAQELVERGHKVHYLHFESHSYTSLEECLYQEVKVVAPNEVFMVAPGEHRVKNAISSVLEESGIRLTILDDNHFLCSLELFDSWAKGRKVLRLEHFYRMARRKYNILMDLDDPAGGKWNYDTSNRSSFPKGGPTFESPRYRPENDQITMEVIDVVTRHFSDHPGELDNFMWPTTRDEALRALDDFIENFLPQFGKYQDAMWSGEPFLGHSLLSSSLNLKLLNPREVLEAAEAAYREGKVPIESAEGFIRQILGWREYVRGLYFYFGESWTKWNHLGATEKLPNWYWSGDVEMVCLSDAIGQTLRFGYAHHIQRLMVTGLFALLWGANPFEVHEWYLAVYVDAVEWVEAPNVIGMSQYGDGGIMASKPYIASGAYISRMSNYCVSCEYSPTKATGSDSCPFTTLYWDFIDRHKEMLTRHPRLGLQVKNLEKKSTSEVVEIKSRARQLRVKWAPRDT